MHKGFCYYITSKMIVSCFLILFTLQGVDPGGGRGHAHLDGNISYSKQLCLETMDKMNPRLDLAVCSTGTAPPAVTKETDA